MNARATRFPLFDSLRAIAILMILVIHVMVFTGSYAGGTWWAEYLPRLNAGLVVLFVISAFLLYRPFVRARIQDKPAMGAGPYAWRRFLRIVPAYWVALTFAAVVIGGILTVDTAAIYYGFAQIYTQPTMNGGLPHAWSLCIEVVFYAFLPLYAFAMRRSPATSRRRRFQLELAGVGALIATGVIYKLAVFAATSSDTLQVTPLMRLLPAYIDQYALGMGLSVASVWMESREALPSALRPIDRFPSMAWLGALLCFWIVATQIGLTGDIFERMSEMQFLARQELWTLAAVCLLLPAIFGDQSRGLVRRLLAKRGLLWLGAISYGVYLYHLAALDLLRRWGFDQVVEDLPALTATWTLAGLAGTVALAATSYYLLERPILRLKGLFGPRREPAPREALAEPAPSGPLPVARPG